VSPAAVTTVRRLRVEHRTTYRYSSAVSASYNELRLTPRPAPGQTVLDSAVEVRPTVRLRPYTDYWGTRVHQFDLHQPHQQLEIVARSVVETGADERPQPPASTHGWEALDEAAFRDRFAEMLAPTPRTPHYPKLVEVARRIRADSTPADAHLAIAQWVRDTLAYEKGTTGVHTTAVEAWRAGRGVCQDFAHLALVLLRSAGIPARYVSGYQLPKSSAEPGATVTGESHAWVEAWIDGAWVGHDPTNGRPAGVDHVLVATGRDYGDVSPVTGIYAGGGSSELTVTVSITRLR
jgi:transglutaminase-like putative cysteine protease